jgi:hypothetical protein
MLVFGAGSQEPEIKLVLSLQQGYGDLTKVLLRSGLIWLIAAVLVGVGRPSHSYGVRRCFPRFGSHT